MQTKLKRLIHWLIAWGSYWYYGRPTRKLIVVGVTGTKGKSTTCRYIASVLDAGGFRVATLSTVEIKIGDTVVPDKPQNTMLGRGQIQKYLKQALKAGCQYAVVETSSEGILQYRHLGLNYDIAVFTNLGTEHQERHGGFENLRTAKGELFKQLAKNSRKIINGKVVPKISVINSDDEHTEFFANFSADGKFRYAINAAPDVNQISAKIVKSDEHGTVFTINGHEYKLNLVGAFNVPNALAAIAVGRAVGIKEDKISLGLEQVYYLPGRMEFIKLGQDYSVVVDYAHEPLSLTALFTSLRPLVKPPGKLVGVIGSDGGGRDVAKRPRMGEVAGRLCDIVIVTDVNAWDEDPTEIAEMLAQGARSAGKKDNVNLFITINRREAIKQACELAGSGGVVAITAKGTESAIVGKNGVRTPWDDSAVAREEINKLL